ncbi:MAG: general stress protein [Roseiflexaceae bacterium]
MKTVVGLFENYTDADRAVSELNAHGFSRNEISVAARDTALRDRVVGETGRERAVGESAGAGAVGGAVVGGLGGLLVGLGALAIPGIGPVIAAGTLATALGTTAAGAGIGAAAGGLIGALVGMGIPEQDANFYAEGVKRGGVLVTVQASDDRAAEALNIMRSARAVDVDTQRRSWNESGWSGRFDETFDPDDRYTWSDRARS